MKTTKKKKNTMSRRSAAGRSSAKALRLKFERTRLGKAVEHARQMQKSHKRGTGDLGDHPPHGPTSTVAMRTMLDSIIDTYLKWKWCRDAENVLDGGIKFLQEHEDELTEQQKEDFRKDLASLLDLYGELC